VAASKPISIPVTVALIGRGLASRGTVVCIDKAEASFADISAGMSLGPNAVEAVGRVGGQMLDACLPLLLR